MSATRAGGALAILAFENEQRFDRPAIDQFLASHAWPLCEGPSVTFVYRGAADAVSLRHGIYGLPSSQQFKRLGASDLWYLIVEIPPNSRVEYKFEVVRNGAGRLVEDPRNDLRSHDPFGSNSVCATTGYEVPDWTRPDPEARTGTLEDLAIRGEGARRRITLYLPARFRRTRRYPLLIVHDGGDYLNYSSLKTVLDNLIHRLEVAEVVVALTHPDDRLHEYANDPRHARFLSEDLLPRLESDLPLIAKPEGRCLMGASFGAVASLSAAWRYPGLYGRLLLQSGSFAFTDIGQSHRGPTFAPVVEFVNAFRAQPIKVADRLFVSCGTYESLIYENRSLVPLLQATGMEVRYVEARDGHNWENWRDRLRDALTWLFPGPLWMVYE